ncbi:hypothetical protein Tco_1540887 [Tanacetum coccineum]
MVESQFNKFKEDKIRVMLCTQPKRPRNATWFKEKLMLAEAQEAGQILDEEQLTFLEDPGISEAPVAHQTIPQNSAFQTDDLDAYDLNCDNLSSAKADVQEMQYSEQTHVDDFQDNEIHSNSNIISYSQYLQETQDAVIQDTNPSAPNDLLVLSLVEQMTDNVAYLNKENHTNKMVNESLTAELEKYKERVVIFEQRLNVDLNKREKLIDSQMDDLIRDRNAKLADFHQEIDTLKETLSNNVKENESLSKTLTMYRSTQAMHMLTKPQVFYDDTHKQALGYQNPFHLKKAQRIQPTLYDGSVIAKEHAVISVIDDEETLILEEESRSKMLDKQNDPISIEKKIKISPIDYSKLNKIKEDFGKRFVTQKELSAEQAFWLKHSSFSETPVTSHTPVRIEAPSELPKVSLVNESLKKLKYQLANFDNVVKKRTTSDAITAGAWGFEHTKACFVTEIIPFLKVLKDTFNAFDKTLLDEIIEVQTVFNQMEAAVDQCSCLELENELFKKKDFVEKEAYGKLVKIYSTLEKHCISLELATQLNQEIFQREISGANLNAPIFNQLFEINELKAQSQEKDTVIRKLKERIKSLSGKNSVKNVKKDIDEIETINIELEHIVAKLLLENENLRKEREHLKSIYKDKFDSIRKTRVQSKEHCDSLIAQINAKSAENSDLNAQLQERTKELDLLNLSSSSNISKKSDSLKTKDSNKPLLTSTGVKPTTSASGLKPSGNTMNNKITRPPSSNQNNALVKHSVRNAKFDSMCAIYKKCLFDANHDMCIIDAKSKRNKMRKVWKPTGKVFADVGYKWKLTGRFFTIVGSSKKAKIVESKIANNSESTQFWGSNATDVPSSSSLVNDRLSRSLSGTIRFENDQVAKIMRYGDYQQGDVIILRVYYVEGLRHNLFYVGQFCDADLEIAFQKNTCFIRNLEGVDLLLGSRDINLYTISLDDMLKTFPICLLSKASKTKS